MKNREKVLSRDKRIVIKGYTHRYTPQHGCRLTSLYKGGEMKHLEDGRKAAG